ncbi:TetR/AcrR family transcriptional regulator C-terminal domain-containing protein [Sphaerisporangium fuscum]|uniref:TetR/AcrR family transcriptional regulator C-terminal domain-containing protein n=1 Tax=Sphaerisporangium fuscum TaxID=2835868 RepID=UPI001BDD5B40|nr:TetR/AcrR family transcriptional regulator C-terminal domain-containing protein [Sphaerisporangium fuscum]
MTSKPPFTSVWARRPDPKRPSRDQPALSRDQIVRAAIELLDAEGMEALSMRKLGARLGAGATSLYWHVTSKDQLLELVLDEVYGEPGLHDPARSGWREAVSAFAHGLRQAILKHPWSVALIGTMPSIGPNAMAVSAMLMKAFQLAGFKDGLVRDYAMGAVMSYTLGATIPEASWMNSIGEVETQEWMDSMHPQIEVAAADYPEMLARFEKYEKIDINVARELSFEFGLLALLDGLEGRIAQQ